MNIKSKVVFEIGQAKKLTTNDRIDELLDLFVSNCRSQPTFFDSNDAKRHAYLLAELSAFPIPQSFLPASRFVPHFNLEKDGPAPRAGRFAIGRLPWILQDWVMHYFDHDRKSMPHYALDTAVCLLNLVTGVLQKHGSEYWKVPALVEEDPREHLYYRAFDRSFKKDFTMALKDAGGLILVGTVPEDHRMAWEFSDRTMFESAQFVLDLTRCHLSEIRDDSYLLDIQPSLTEGFRMSESFRFQGCVCPWDGISDLRKLDWKSYKQSCSVIPHTWVTHEVVRGESRNEPWDLKPLPTWDIPALLSQPLG